MSCYARNTIDLKSHMTTRIYRLCSCTIEFIKQALHFIFTKSFNKFNNTYTLMYDPLLGLYSLRVDRIKKVG